jgi:hypothetical protein
MSAITSRTEKRITDATDIIDVSGMAWQRICHPEARKAELRSGSHSAEDDSPF